MYTQSISNLLFESHHHQQQRLFKEYYYKLIIKLQISIETTILLTTLSTFSENGNKLEDVLFVTNFYMFCTSFSHPQYHLRKL